MKKNVFSLKRQLYILKLNKLTLKIFGEITHERKVIYKIQKESQDSHAVGQICD